MSCGCTAQTAPPPLQGCGVQFDRPGSPTIESGYEVFLAQLAAFRVDLPGQGEVGDNVNVICGTGASASVQLLGQSNQFVNLSLLIRGAVEPIQVTSGTSSSLGIIGGTVVGTGNRWMLTISGTSATDEDGASLTGKVIYIDGYSTSVSRSPHVVNKLGVFLNVRADSLITLSVVSPSRFEPSNVHDSDPPPTGVPPSPNHYNGQFMQLDPFSITAAG
jgi:hypothetical protein